MAKEHLKLLLQQEGDIHCIAIEYAKPLPTPRTSEDIVVGDGKDEQGSKQVISKGED
jgi:hypothetical protein